MIPFVPGDRLRSKLTGKVLELKSMVDRIALLESSDQSCRVLTEIDALRLFYEKVDHGSPTEGATNPLEPFSGSTGNGGFKNEG
jgi:hypothetical protein